MNPSYRRYLTFGLLLFTHLTITRISATGNGRLLLHNSAMANAPELTWLKALQKKIPALARYLKIAEYKNDQLKFHESHNTYETIFILKSNYTNIVDKPIPPKIPNLEKKETPVYLHQFPEILFQGSKDIILSPPLKLSLLQDSFIFPEYPSQKRACVLVSGKSGHDYEPFKYTQKGTNLLSHTVLLQAKNESGKVWCALSRDNKVFFEQIHFYIPEMSIALDPFLTQNGIISSTIKIRKGGDTTVQDLSLRIRFFPTNEGITVFSENRKFLYDTKGKFFYLARPNNLIETFSLTGNVRSQPLAISYIKEPPSHIETQISWKSYTLKFSKQRLEYASIFRGIIHFLGWPLFLLLALPLFLVMLMLAVHQFRKLFRMGKKTGAKPAAHINAISRLSFLIEPDKTYLIQSKVNPFQVHLRNFKSTVEIQYSNNVIEIQLNKKPWKTFTPDQENIALPDGYSLQIKKEHYKENNTLTGRIQAVLLNENQS